MIFINPYYFALEEGTLAEIDIEELNKQGRMLMLYRNKRRLDDMALAQLATDNGLVARMFMMVIDCSVYNNAIPHWANLLHSNTPIPKILSYLKFATDLKDTYKDKHFYEIVQMTYDFDFEGTIEDLMEQVIIENIFSKLK